MKRWWLRLTGVPDCQNCGLCCAPGYWLRPEGERAKNYVGLSALDRAVMSPSTRLRVIDEELNAVRMDGDALNTRCTALLGAVREHVTCSIYDERPKDCRTFEPGSEKCRFVLMRARQPASERTGPVWKWIPWWKPYWVRHLVWRVKYAWWWVTTKVQQWTGKTP